MVTMGNSLTVTDEEFPPLGPTRQASITSIPPGLQETTRRSTPALPPGLEEAIQSRRGTPTRPPGLSKPEDEDQVSLQKRPTALPDLEGHSRPSSRASLRRAVSSQIVPALPLRTATPAKVGSRPGTPARLTSRPVSPVNKLESSSQDTPTRPSKSKDLVNADVLQAEDESRSTTVAGLDQPGVSTPVLTKAAMKAAVAKPTTPVTLEKSDAESIGNKRKHLGKLDISAAVHQQQEASDALEPTTMARKIAAAQTAAASSAPSSPSAVAASPVVKNAPRTIRLVQTPKAETPPIVLPAIMPGVRKLPSRQPSIASMNLPGTPTSEQVSTSDNVSVNSMSRADTPPPIASKVGTAPVRTKTKSQQKKERQEKAKALEEAKAEASAHVVADEPLQEAIVGRKKKAKKEKEIKPKPKPAVVKDEEPVKASPVVSRPASPVEAPAAEEILTPPPVIKAGPELSPPATPTMSPAQLISELKNMEPHLSRSFEALFRIPGVSNVKNLDITAKDIEGHAAWRTTDGIKLGKEDINKLLSGYAATLAQIGPPESAWGRAMITPGGAQLRALSEELEQRFLELEKHIMDLPEELRFRPTKPQNETRFPAMDLKAMRKAFDSKGPRGVSVMEQMVQDGSAMKKGAFLVDEVSKYINEFVMPPATPPPSAGRGAAAAHAQQAQREPGAHAAAAGGGAEMPVPPVEIADRQLHEARRAVDDRESALRKVIRKNKKLIGVS